MTTTKLLHCYQNGNYVVSIFSDGTKTRESVSGNFNPRFPESIDLKITNFCNLSVLCKYCHEKSTVYGEHANFERILNFVDGLPQGVEIAIGGGNPLSHPDIDEICTEFNRQGLIANITINQEHIEKAKIPEKVKGVGISFRRRKFIPKIKEINHVIHHLILGVHTWEDFLWLCNNYYAPKILWLGFKTIGNGNQYFAEKGFTIKQNIDLIKTNLETSLNHTNLIAFDNLAIEQLSPHEIFSKGDFMGDDGQYSFYFDAVQNKYAIGSSYNERKEAYGLKATEIFESLKSGIN